jgi:mono/diheme cytochrome c family protein
MLERRWKVSLFLLTALFAISWGSLASSASGAEGQRAGAAARVSYYEQVRPILVANCQGCHQPANASGGYVMTAFEKLLTGGSSRKPAIVPRHPEKSRLVQMITPHQGKAAMPMGRKPLSSQEIERIRQWIAEGAPAGLYPAGGDHGARFLAGWEAAGRGGVQ